MPDSFVVYKHISAHSAFNPAVSSRAWRRLGILAALILSTALATAAQISVLTQHNDIGRTGQNTNETILNTSNVNVAHFAKLFSLPVAGQVYAQPLYVQNVTIAGTSHNVLIVATETDHVYAFDADTKGPALWTASMVDQAHGAKSGEHSLQTSTTIGCTDLQPQIGISSTPVIDALAQTIYVEAKSQLGSTYIHRLHALDLTTGLEKAPGPVEIIATVNGTGDGSQNGKIVFDQLHQHNRSGLLLLNGEIYIAFASHCDFGPYHGWLFAYNTTNFAQSSLLMTTPNGGLGGFWMAGSGVAADGNGNIYIASGNGTFDTNNVPATELGDTVLKLGTTNGKISLLDYFTPSDQNCLEAQDTDLGSGGVLVVPTQGTNPDLLVAAGKEGAIYVVNRDQMTAKNVHYVGKSTCTTQDPEILEESASGAVGGMWSMPAYWNSTLYYWGSGDVLKSIPVTGGLPDFTHVTGNTTSIGFPGATPSISSNGTTAGTAIVWAIDSSQYGSPGPGPGPAVLHAYDATNISNELWNSAQAIDHRDQPGNAVKFSVPTIANGKVYIGTSGQVQAYGLLPVVATPVISPSSESFQSSLQISMSDATPGAVIHYTLDGSTPTQTHGNVYKMRFTITASKTVQAVAVAPKSANSEVASETYTRQP
jgi:Chitobiase/beta-hexosaminidase C-terminal domain